MMFLVYSLETGRVLKRQNHKGVVGGEAVIAEPEGLEGRISDHVVSDGIVSLDAVDRSFAALFPTERQDAKTLAMIKSECRNRILAVASQTDQQNMSAAVASAEMTGADLNTYSALLQWIKAMRLKSAELVEVVDYSYADDEHWPDTPDGARELAQKY